MNPMFIYAALPVPVAYDGITTGNNDAYCPQHWAMEALTVLEESMVMSRLVHRDYNSQVRSFGDVVNAGRPRKFVSKRKTDRDCVEDCDAISDNVQVALNQHHYKSFVIKDGESSLCFKDLVSTYLKPAVQAVARGVDRSVMGQVHRFLNCPSVGRLGGLSAANVRQQITEAREKMQLANVPQEDRRLILGPTSESALLNVDMFVSECCTGDSDALRTARIKDLFGFQIYSANNVPCISDANTSFGTGTMTNAIDAGAAPTVQPVTMVGTEVQVGEWAVIAGDGQPRYVTAATVGGGDTTDITLDGPNKCSTPAGTDVKVYAAVQANNAYGVCYTKELSVTGSAPQVGQLIATGTGPDRQYYTIIESYADPSNAANQLILLDRPLDAAIASGENIFPGPAGCFNLAFHKDAIAFVNRPLALPAQGLGVSAAVANYNDLSMRVVMSYDPKCQGTRVTVDTLSGVALLDKDLACLFLG